MSRPVYLRIGDWDPAFPVSRNYATGDHEIGLSVYELDAEGMPVEPQEAEWAGADMRERLAGDQPKHLVTGSLVGWGHDGEPLLADVGIVGAWTPPT